MRVVIENVVDFKVGKVKNQGRSDIRCPFIRELEIQTGSGDTLVIELGAWDARTLVGGPK